MVSEFLTPIEKLRIPNSVPNHQLFQEKYWPFNKNQNPRCYCTDLLEYGKDNYWDGDKMTD